MTFTEEYVRGLADRHGWGWLPMDQVTLTFAVEDDDGWHVDDPTVFLLPAGMGAATARAWITGQVLRGLDGCTVEALVHTINAACPELNRDGRHYGVAERFAAEGAAAVSS